MTPITLKPPVSHSRSLSNNFLKLYLQPAEIVLFFVVVIVFVAFSLRGMVFIFFFFRVKSVHNISGAKEPTYIFLYIVNL